MGHVQDSPVYKNLKERNKFRALMKNKTYFEDSISASLSVCNLFQKSFVLAVVLCLFIGKVDVSGMARGLPLCLFIGKVEGSGKFSFGRDATKLKFDEATEVIDIVSPSIELCLVVCL